ncbi:hypothetical protein ICJ04_09060 [Stenotrophomonas sp. 169]|uniref:hypothetical protein n=1 Tax=Stenotrophomonas sp. 169 TaxID=2770322 RepID=UPI001662260F|nr:hypothetical protein [Stenotrophomonas sp. 169]QNR95749.1 hypothetical protein ICJ04_09060 [Stenotrophomonas sp. 169]
MIPTSYWRKSWGTFVRPNSGTFDILDISCLQEPASQRIVHLYALHVQCMECQHGFDARDGHGISTVTGARVLRCPQCAASQAVANTELVRFASSSTSSARPRSAASTQPALAMAG